MTGNESGSWGGGGIGRMSIRPMNNYDGIEQNHPTDQNY